MILIVAFLSILTVTFGVMAVVTGPSQGQKVIERRIVDLASSKGGEGSPQFEASQILKQEPDSQFQWLEKLLEKYQFSRMIEKQIMQANSKTTLGKLLISSLGFSAASFAVAHFFVPVLAIQAAVAAIAAYVPFFLISRKRAKRLNDFNKALPDAIDMMGRSLRAGHSMIAAIGIVAEQSVEPVASEFREVFRQQNFGIPLRDALNQMLEHVPSQDLRVLATGILVQKETGGNLAEILDRIVAVIRDRLRIQGEIKTHTAQGRMTGYILCALPIVMLFVINLVNPGYSKVLLETPLGHKLIYAGLFLLTTGALIIRAIINGIEI
jgi:tight adherence protein B